MSIDKNDIDFVAGMLTDDPDKFIEPTDQILEGLGHAREGFDYNSDDAIQARAALAGEKDTLAYSSAERRNLEMIAYGHILDVHRDSQARQHELDMIKAQKDEKKKHRSAVPTRNWIGMTPDLTPQEYQPSEGVEADESCLLESEFEQLRDCSKCGGETLHICSGSGKKSTCYDCGTNYGGNPISGEYNEWFGNSPS